MPQIKVIKDTDLNDWEKKVNEEYTTGKWKFIQTHITEHGYVAVLISAN